MCVAHCSVRAIDSTVLLSVRLCISITDYGMKAWLEKKGMAAEKVSYYVDSELLNGRLAMLGFMGMHSAAAANGSHFPFL